MSPATAHVARRASRARTRVRRRRRLGALLAVGLAAVVTAVAAGVGPFGDAVREFVTLPLRHDDIIRQQAAEKDLDAALVAAVIYEESRFRDQTSNAGARGLMQITPDTADYIARRSGGTRFVQEDLATPQINIAYGTWFLRYLIDHYEGNETLAVAAYNAGITNVDGWVKRAGGPDEFDASRDVPFPETRAYVENVAESRESYRTHHGDALGL